MKFQKILAQAKIEQSFIRLYTEAPDNDYHDGLIVCLNNDFLILIQELDYAFEGFVLIPRKQISGYRQSDVESFSQRLMKSNNDIPASSIASWVINSKTYNDLFSGIMSSHPWLDVAWVCPNCTNIHYDIGKLVSNDDDSIGVQLYENSGHKIEEMGWSMNKIFSIKFETNFLNKFGRYIDEKQ